ncbi:MAG: poly-gamma-glutamate biosynthesis protein PgsC [Candidatus Aminicenantes bacterium]|nr:poly-gamma-glutamate biosynthesis protein PgsC [Candidatus Aminicenantes bacterium]
MAYETLLIGILAALLFVEIFDFYPGGIIVPAYFALFLDQPLRVLVTLLIAGLSLVCFKGLARCFLLFGKRRFVFLVLIGALLSQVWFMLAPSPAADPAGWQAIGWVIPGLLANNLERQKILPTLGALVSVAVLTYFFVRILVSLGL